MVLQLIVLIQRIVEEAHAWSRLQHENVLSLIGIVTVFDFAVSFVSEWMDNGNAYDYVQNDANDPRHLVSNNFQLANTSKQSLAQLLGIASGLNYLHNIGDKPIIHGDLRGVRVIIGSI